MFLLFFPFVFFLFLFFVIPAFAGMTKKNKKEKKKSMGKMSMLRKTTGEDPDPSGCYMSFSYSKPYSCNSFFIRNIRVPLFLFLLITDS